MFYEMHYYVIPVCIKNKEFRDSNKETNSANIII